jgi:hypothetical protein
LEKISEMKLPKLNYRTNKTRPALHFEHVTMEYIMNDEAESLLDQYIDSALYSPSKKQKDYLNELLPPIPSLPSINSFYYLVENLKEEKEEEKMEPMGPFSAAQLHSWAGSGQVSQDSLVHEIRHRNSSTPSSLGWMPLGDAGLCDHRWYCRDETVSDEIQGPFTPGQMRSWFADGQLYWKYANVRTDRGVIDEVDAWYYLGDNDEPQGPFPILNCVRGFALVSFQKIV